MQQAKDIRQRSVRFDGVEIAAESFGRPGDPPVLLIMGAMASMLWWPEAFCRRLADAGRQVVRYDNRDTGRSTAYPPGAPGYSLDDLADDAVRVLDAHGLAAAHVVGMSLGGMVAQIAALRHPDRVATLTVVSSTPLGIDTSHLPGTSAAYMAHAATAEDLDWSDRTAVVGFMTADARMIAGTVHPHDAEAARALIERDVDRARNFAAATNHFLLKGGEGWHISGLKAPLLVVHGTADPIFPPEHGAALAGAAPGSELVLLGGGGHELHPGHWDQIVAAIVRHTARA